MQNKTQIRIIIILLMAVGLGSAIYKHEVLGFSFVPAKKISVWTIESAITFDALGGPADVSFNLPDSNSQLNVLDITSIDKDFKYSLQNNRAHWQNSDAKGRQKIYLRVIVSRKPEETPSPIPDFKSQTVDFSSSANQAANSLIADSKQKISAKKSVLATRLLAALNDPTNPDAHLLVEEAEDFGGRVEMATALLGKAGISARPVKGIQLSDQKKIRKLKQYIQFKSEQNTILLLNPRTAKIIAADNFLLWQKGGESILDITGGKNGRVSFSALEGKMAAERAAVITGHKQGSVFIDFSIYSLPIKDQNTFKLLLLIPIGALVVVVLRNIVGISTSGTFMPILIAMVFLQTTLLVGLGLFILVVSVGLLLRSYLSRLDLLLVPRISAVLVFVIVIFVAISVTSVKMGFESGLQVTFFPMIITSWTIERMSVLWEEEGPRDVFIQGGGSLLAASLIYFAMGNSYIGHLTYSFPELLLVVLAIIIMLGSYSGFRLTELRRFEPLTREDKNAN